MAESSAFRRVLERKIFMYIIAGLGNPTKEYEGTRHNVGFQVIDKIAEKYNIAVDAKKGRAYVRKRNHRRSEGSSC